MEQRNHSIDHIDPQWKEGREYQLVCGLDAKVNLRLEDNDINIRKSNRFVPYRVVSGIPLHQEPDDWGVFLIQGEWRLCRFMGREWWEESNKIGNGTILGARMGLQAAIRNNPNHQSYAASFRETEVLSRSGKLGAQALHETHPTLASETMTKTNKQLWEDPLNPHLGRHNSGNLARIQRFKGLPSGPENRVKVI